MIVISAALLLVSLVLLLIGLLGTGLGFIYASIVVSVLAFVVLLFGIMQRRGEPVSARPGPGVDPSASFVGGHPPAVVDLEKSAREKASVAASGPVATPELEPPAEHDDERLEDEDVEFGGLVFVVRGRPGYHVEGCGYLAGRDAEPVDVVDAREEGFSPCGSCKPDAMLAENQQLAADPESARTVGEYPTRSRPVADGTDQSGLAVQGIPVGPPAPGPVVRGAAARTSAAAVFNKLKPAPRSGYVPVARSRPVRLPSATTDPAPTVDPGAGPAAGNATAPTTDPGLIDGSGTDAAAAKEPAPPRVDSGHVVLRARRPEGTSS